VLDENGAPKKEKGFYLFKNSWGTTSFGVDHPYGAGYGWLSMQYVAEYGSAAVAEIPSLTPDVPEPMGGTTYTYDAAPDVAIPDASPAGVSSSIDVTDTGTVGEVKVTTDITHTYRGDLQITLTHGSTSKLILDHEGGSVDDVKDTFTVAGFDGAALDGTWTIKVEDGAGYDTGTLHGWKLEVTTR